MAGLTVKEGIASERDWLSPIMRLMAELGGELPEGEIIVNPDAGLVKVSAEFETRQEQRDIKDDVEEILAGVTLDFSSGLTVKDAPRVTAEEVQELQENINDLIEGKVVEFEFNSAVITPLGEELLDEVLAALRQFPNVPIEIAGHTDNVGSPEANLELSEERARARPGIPRRSRRGRGAVRRHRLRRSPTRGRTTGPSRVGHATAASNSSPSSTTTMAERSNQWATSPHRSRSGSSWPCSSASPSAGS